MTTEPLNFDMQHSPSEAIFGAQVAYVPPPVEPPPAILHSSENLSSEEMDKAFAQLNALPGEMQGQVSVMVNANRQDPAKLNALVRELTAQMEKIKANPHLPIQGVSPELAGICASYQQAELKQPDPLNLLRDQGQAASTGTGLSTALGIVSTVAEAEHSPVHSVHFHGTDYPLSELGQLTPTQTPDARSPALLAERNANNARVRSA